MKEIRFDRLIDAIYYHKHCPFCNSKLSLSDRKSCTFEDCNLVFNHTGTTVMVDSISGLITLGKKSDISGTLIIKIELDCYKCSMYHYIIATYLDLTALKFIYAVLNTEFFSFEEGESGLYDIHNNYARGITTFTHYPYEDEGKSFETPLIPINFSNPRETLTRIKNLIVFT